MNLFTQFFQCRGFDFISGLFPSVLAFFSLICGMRIQEGRENKKEQIETFIRNGLECQILGLTKLKESLMYSCLMYVMILRNNGAYDAHLFKNKLKELYVHIEPNVAQVRMNIYGNEFCEAIEMLNLVIRKQLCDLEMLLVANTPQKEEFALIVFEIEAILNYVIAKFTALLNIVQAGLRVGSLNHISNSRKVKILRGELKEFSKHCVQILGTKDKEEIWGILKGTVKNNKEGLARMGILVEALDNEFHMKPVESLQN